MLRTPCALKVIKHLPVTRTHCLAVVSRRQYSSHSGGKVDDVSSPIQHVENIVKPPPVHNFTSTSTQDQYITNTDTDLKKYSHLFANPKIKAIIDRIVRVDQAGEFGAARMYLHFIFHTQQLIMIKLDMMANLLSLKILKKVL